VQYAFDTTGAPNVILTAIGALRPTGVCGLVGVQTAPLTIAPNFLSAGRNVMGILEGDAIPQVFIPEMIALWRQGRFLFDRLVQTFAFEDIDRAEQSSLSGEVVKPVLLANCLKCHGDENPKGKLRLSKRAGETALLSGKLLLPETRYELVRQGASEVPALTGVRFKAPRDRPRITGNEPAIPRGSLLEGVRLDLDLTAPNQLFVTGMGLDSEWRADLHVTGTIYDKRVAGSIDLVRGNLGFAGRQFELQEGRLIFTGGMLSDPQIALRATEVIDDIAVTINVVGRALNPQIAFSSSPSLPSDEVLSRILFGNSVGQLSPIQAIQLAASLNSLRGGGGGLNPLGKLRAATGISRLRILSPDEASGRGTAIAAGRYISNNVYLEVISDARGFTATRIEVSLSPVLSILSEAGGSGVTSFNVRYRKRY